MKKACNILVSLILLLSSSALHAQQEVPMADGMRSEGKIYVVVAILTIILAGLIVYLFIIDRKVSKMEKHFPDQQ
jgi:CcmD family protein